MYSHGAVAAKQFGKAVVEASFEHHTKITAPIREEVRLACEMLHKLTHEPHLFSADDVQPLLDYGLSPAAIEHPILVGGYFFNGHNRMIDAFGSDIPEEKADGIARMLNQAGKKPRKDRIKAGQTVAYSGKMPKIVTDWLDYLASDGGVVDPQRRVSVMNLAANHTDRTNSRPVDDLHPAVVDYVETMARDAIAISEDHITSMKQAGLSELEIFEVTFAASTGTGLARLEVAWGALAEAIAERV